MEKISLYNNEPQYLVIKYFDYYPMKKYLFYTEKDAKKFVEEENEKVKHYPKTEYIYRGKNK
ncbi:hypothetical protein [Peptostreptococcus porci]|uniref:hypothetical protein n=1 Tax=Peptostreptococcus porci TaxID=2652282 RepID=UPI002A90E9C8|nr:hypothetical protein [Peptostreptococcus porci]MDY6232811.1 hypothetical protein [Peptostreptococcus porci]